MSEKHNWLSFLRHQKGWTQKKLAEASGVPISTIARIEVRGSLKSRKNIDKLLHALDTDMKNLSIKNKF